MRVFVLLLPFVVGCKFLSALDFGGVEKEPFELRMGWDHGIHQAAAGTKPGETDSNGVYKTEAPKADALLSFPNVHAGICGEIQPKERLTPVINLEILSMKAPYVGWWEIQVGAGADIAEVYLGKRLLSVWEITVGPWVGWDFVDSHRQSGGTLQKAAYGFCFTLIKF